MIHPLVTIVVTTRNRQNLVGNAIESALVQDFAELEVLVVDDGSEPAIALAHDDDRISLIRRDLPGGPSAARNAALSKARGEWITFLDDDDRLLPTMVSASLGAALTSSLPPPVSIISGMELVHPGGGLLGRRFPVSLPRGRHYFLEDAPAGGTFHVHNTLFVPTDLLREIGGWDEDLKGTEHDDLFLRLNQRCSLQGLDKVTYRLTVHQGPRRSKDVLARAEAMERTMIKHRRVFARHRRKWARYLTTTGVTYLRAGRWSEAISATTRGLLRNPASLRGWIMWMAALGGPLMLKLIRAQR